jgi:hypothetical protein
MRESEALHLGQSLEPILEEEHPLGPKLGKPLGSCLKHLEETLRLPKDRRTSGSHCTTEVRFTYTTSLTHA